MSLRTLGWALLVAVAGMGCGDDDGTDAGTDDAGTDAALVCSADAECDDGVFCNGAESCEPGDPSADELGCVVAEGPACLPSQTCDEDADTCLSDCAVAPDADGDGVEATECGGTDCDDADANRFPGNAEVCDDDDRDEDCDPSTFGDRDEDMDGYIDAACCNTDGASVQCGDDCDDTAAAAHPTEAESCDLIDNDCDGTVDESLPTATYYPDCDADLQGATGSAGITQCAAPSDGPEACADGGWATNDDDCDDTDAARNTSSVELCNGIDDDCNGMLDGPDEDDDMDGHADACAGAASTDCNDTDPTIYEGAPELCDRLDNDCSSGGGVEASEDADDDGHAPIGASCSGGDLPVDDCDDAVETVFEGASELCDFVDNDCDGSSDEGLPETTVCYPDADGDGFGEEGASPVMRCGCVGDVSANDTDCCDMDANAFPCTGLCSFYTTANACGSFDYDCNGTVEGQPRRRTDLFDMVAGCPSSVFACSTFNCVITGGWQGSVPACGESAPIDDCGCSGSSNCVVASTEMDTRHCR